MNLSHSFCCRTYNPEALFLVKTKVIKSCFPWREMKDLDSLPRGEDKRKKDSMTRTKSIANLLALSLLLAASAVAGNTNKATLKVSETVSVGGKQLRAGQYQVEWAGSGPDVELTISNGRETVAKVPAQILPLTKAEASSGYSIN